MPGKPSPLSRHCRSHRKPLRGFITGMSRAAGGRLEGQDRVMALPAEVSEPSMGLAHSLLCPVGRRSIPLRRQKSTGMPIRPSTDLEVGVTASVVCP